MCRSGEDLYVTFTHNGHLTSDTIKVQVKGGSSRRRGNGYAVRVDQHGDTWANGNIPVYCMVYDPDTRQLHWANGTQQLRRSGPLSPPRFIEVSPNAVLDDTTMEPFVAQARRYVGRYRDRQAVLTHLGEMSGVEFDPADHVLHFVNGYDEDLIFWARLQESVPGVSVRHHVMPEAAGVHGRLHQGHEGAATGEVLGDLPQTNWPLISTEQFHGAGQALVSMPRRRMCRSRRPYDRRLVSLVT